MPQDRVYRPWMFIKFVEGLELTGREDSVGVVKRICTRGHLYDFR